MQFDTAGIRRAIILVRAVPHVVPMQVPYIITTKHYNTSSRRAIIILPANSLRRAVSRLNVFCTNAPRRWLVGLVWPTTCPTCLG